MERRNNKETEAITADGSHQPLVSELPGCVVYVAEGGESDRGRHITLRRGTIRVGAASNCDLCLADPKVSREHVEIGIGRQGITVQDLGSTNGTLYQNQKIERATLTHGARLVLGKTALVLLPLSNGQGIEPSIDSNYERILGGSLPMRRMFAVLQRLETSQAPILIHGETGTGKEIVARAIHAQSPRRDGPFVVVDCGTIPRELAESELFGHVKGSFTGATADREGAFEQAHMGTVFLDEIGELPLELQPRLLRALENQEVKRVGESRYRPVDVRVLAATHADLRTAVAQNRFREDLFFRLAVLPLDVPPLRDRLDDIPMLVQSFAKEIQGPDAPPLPAEVLTAMAAYDWPGNVRELRNAVHRVLSLGTFAPPVGTGPEMGPPRVEVSIPYKVAREKILDQFESSYVKALLGRNKGNISAAAREAGIQRRYFRELIRKHGLYRDPTDRDAE